MVGGCVGSTAPHSLVLLAPQRDACKLARSPARSTSSGRKPPNPSPAVWQTHLLSRVRGGRAPGSVIVGPAPSWSRDLETVQIDVQMDGPNMPANRASASQVFQTKRPG